MGIPIQDDAVAGRGILARGRARIGALPAGVISGALFGALIGGVAGRAVMRLIFLLDDSTDGAKTDFGTVGEITVDGSFTLLMLSTITGVIGGMLYVGVRRWLPWSGAARGVFFGLLMAFAPGLIFLGEVDLQIFEPAVPVYWTFIGLIVVYGVCVALLTDRLHVPRDLSLGSRSGLVLRVAQGLAALAVCALAVGTTIGVYDEAGSCLTADGEGGCGAHATDAP